MKTNHKTLALAMGTTLLSGLTTVTAQASQNSAFEMTELSSGYMQLAAETTSTESGKKVVEAKCAGAKPISSAPKASEGKCGEGKCGGDMKKSASDTTNSATDANKAKTAEGKCGEGKCGGEMKKTPADTSKTTTDSKSSTESATKK